MDAETGNFIREKCRRIARVGIEGMKRDAPAELHETLANLITDCAGLVEQALLDLHRIADALEKKCSYGTSGPDGGKF